MRVAGDIDDARVWCESIQQTGSQTEMTQVIGANLTFKAIFGQGIWNGHDTGIVKQNIDGRVVLANPIGESID